VSAIRLLKWLLVSLNTDKLRSTSAGVASRVYPNTSKILMFGKESGSADSMDFIKVLGKWALLECLDNLLNHHYLTTTELAGRHTMIQIDPGEASLV